METPEKKFWNNVLQKLESDFREKYQITPVKPALLHMSPSGSSFKFKTAKGVELDEIKGWQDAVVADPRLMGADLPWCCFKAVSCLVRNVYLRDMIRRGSGMFLLRCDMEDLQEFEPRWLRSLKLHSYIE